MGTIYYGGRVFTGRLPLQEAFLMEDNRFAGVGTDEKILARCKKDDQLAQIQTLYTFLDGCCVFER